MHKKEFLTQLEEIIEAEPQSLVGNEPLSNYLSWDSLAVVGFIALVDGEFDLTLSARKVNECETVADLLTLVGDRIAA
jgi:acyl carrier protein